MTPNMLADLPDTKCAKHDPDHPAKHSKAKKNDDDVKMKRNEKNS